MYKDLFKIQGIPYLYLSEMRNFFHVVITCIDVHCLPVAIKY